MDLVWESLLDDRVALFFATFIVIWFCLATLLIVTRLSRADALPARLIAITPGSLATLGVLGTFTGILLGLLQFDVSDIDGSVPSLLAGLKTAFLTSIVGIATAVLTRLQIALFSRKQQGGSLTADTFFELLKDMKKEQQIGNQQMKEHSQQMIELASGDTGLFASMTRISESHHENHCALIAEFRAFKEHMVENNQRAIIEALEGVIRDFNDKLTEQFGENFAQLNQSVERLVVWQEHYKEHISVFEERIKIAAESLEASKTAVSGIRTDCEAIPTSLLPLTPVLSGLQNQLDHMDSHLQSLADLRDRAVEAFPTIESNLDKLTTQFSGGIERAVTLSEQALTDGETVSLSLRNDYEQYVTAAGEARDLFNQELASVMKQLSEQSEQEFERHGKLIESGSQKAQEAINEAWIQNTEKLNTQFNNFDQQMQQELERALNVFGGKLVSLSDKFVSDYSPLTERLQALVNTGRAA